MSHGKLRLDNNCLNCGRIVEEKFCPNCGQENIEPKQKFHYLFTHFIEDFTHYDGQFWKTIKYLLFKPGKLTNEYLAGKRQQYVVPVKLYIFMSFITFFLFSLSSPISSPSVLDNKAAKKEAQKEIMDAIRTNDVLGNVNAGSNHLTKKDSLALIKARKIIGDSAKVNNLLEAADISKKLSEESNIYGAKTKVEFDKYQKSHPSWTNFLKRPFADKFFELKELGIPQKEILVRFLETAFHNLPKALFIYLPLFAFFLWIFHNKKKWWYFDHGIFTLHYFSYLLLIITLFWVIDKIFRPFSGVGFFQFIRRLSIFLITIYTLIYFFLAHHRVYNSGRKFSVLIGIVLFILNFFAFSFVLVCLIGLSFLMVK
ncbi:DUF3667 domain-containing protein [Halpernia frigidisoli]|uniref:DUF3667 domain-containing protein n=1 Tax=Halpernia frigidisoli TaxID=1125876 RepID=A0A1I3HWK1_9FLAO|nr:DUF3667 domain-containing protein [Halpernia frigidisoli]SFI40116.1 Protein of unknown function [Halpernia frigidisoli]